MSITAKNISKSYRGEKALKNFNAMFENGETSVLIGPMAAANPHLSG